MNIKIRNAFKDFFWFLVYKLWRFENDEDLQICRK